MANRIDLDQISRAVRSRSALFAHAILSETLVYQILEHLLYTKKIKCPKIYN